MRRYGVVRMWHMKLQMNSRWAIGLAVALFAAEVANAAGPVVIAGTISNATPQQPLMAIGTDGMVHVAFGIKASKTHGDVFYARSVDGGQTFSAPAKVGSVEGLALGMRRGPRIALSNDGVCISVISHKEGNIHLYRLKNDGDRWLDQAVINDKPGSAGEGLHAMAAGSKGELACVWLDHRNDQSQVYSATSADGGKTWSKNVRVYRSPDGDVCPCCHPSVAYSPDGKIHALWRNDVGGNRDMYHAISSDGGKTFGAAQKLGVGAWTLNRCPMDGGSIAVLAGEKIATIWRRDKTVYSFDSGSLQETPLGPGEQPWIAASSKGPVAVWLRKRGESLMLQLPGKQRALELSKAAVDPVITSGGENNSIVIAAWEDATGRDKRIICQRIDLLQ